MPDDLTLADWREAWEGEVPEAVPGEDVAAPEAE